MYLMDKERNVLNGEIEREMYLMEREREMQKRVVFSGYREKDRGIESEPERGKRWREQCCKGRGRDVN